MENIDPFGLGRLIDIVVDSIEEGTRERRIERERARAERERREKEWQSGGSEEFWRGYRSERTALPTYDICFYVSMSALMEDRAPDKVITLRQGDKISITWRYCKLVLEAEEEFVRVRFTAESGGRQSSYTTRVRRNDEERLPSDILSYSGYVRVL